MQERFDALYAAFERLSSREQSMLLLTIVLVLGGIVGFSSYFVSSALNAQQRRISGKIQKLAHIHELRADYQARLREQQRLTSEVKRNGRTRILSHIERIAKMAGVKIKNVSTPRGTPSSSPEVQEETAKFTVDSVSIDRLNNFLSRLDRGNKLIVVRGVRIKNNYEKPKRLDATITVGTFKMAGG